jgi:predicted MPP superfamily phosphohydrolase
MLFLPLILIASYIIGLVVVLIGVSNVKNPVNTYLTYGKGNNSLKIVAVSDIHYDTTGCIIDLKDLVNDINKENPDIVFFLGDTVDNYMQNYSITTHESHPHLQVAKFLLPI